MKSSKRLFLVCLTLVYLLPLTALDLQTATLENSNSIEKPAILDLEFKAADVSMRGTNKLYFSPLLAFRFKTNPFILKDRSYPVDFIYPLKEKQVIEWKIPKGWTVESLPSSEKLTLGEKGCVFYYKLSQKDQSILVNFHIAINKLVFEPTDYQNLKSFFDKVAEKIGEQVVLVKTMN